MILPCEKAGFVGTKCELYYPNCTVEIPQYIGDGYCDNVEPFNYNTEECGYDGGDCENSLIELSSEAVQQSHVRSTGPRI